MAAAREIQLLERVMQTKFGARVRLFLIIDKKMVSARWKSLSSAALEGYRVDVAQMLIMGGVTAEVAQRLRAQLLSRFEWLDKVSDQAFVEIYLTVHNRGKMVDVVVRGLTVERLIAEMKEMARLTRELETQLAARGKGWGKLQLLSGLKTGDGRQIADWTLCAVHEDGRIWVMAIIESKSISNMEHLIEQKGRGTGQFLKDFMRAKLEGLIIDIVDLQGNISPRKFRPAQVLLEPIPPGATKLGPYPTRFIGVVPDKFSARQLLNAETAGLAMETWAWPVSQSEMLKLINAIEKSISR
ncbi:hypothetical protein [Sphingomonas qomolangmaensis]|uniref:Uncharacterized protein n=1 Tax=Sphingomonas qomolangmaensis TaxID=2918765 RepID=A0ABY5LD99_9SPHN|nr:hypothetical protein [Sphingomonas qomolangmaensis]UUL83805.1 hypothetical protein NMP03_06315 [Sphingomonas qomolangmaensis]